ncbi:phosphotransferase family protein [Paramicrobacterium agarici]|uniref:phosphotransferase family protein n=1 Tax=Paramicrobacterium agarici TaxID=630514 RepID=UPI001151CA02|nr:phosphotransferase [Microbacterium agarici]TQO22775.1 phosphotransferase family enzyme [Microbacterium agarici]
MIDPLRHDTEVLALRALASCDPPVPELVEVEPGSILMSLMPGERLDSVAPQVRLNGLRASARLLRRLHAITPPRDLPRAPNDAAIIRRYRDAGGPPLPLSIPPSAGSSFCHGDWSDANILAIDGAVTAVVDWESAHVGDPLRELSRAAWAASRKDPRAFALMVEAYGADMAAVRAWSAIHAAELWLWFAEAGPPEYFEQLTLELKNWPAGQAAN